MARREHRLGRGLESLIPYLPIAPGSQVIEVDINAVLPNPKQPRQKEDDEGLAELAASIQEHGILQPLMATKEGERYQLVAGARRWRAAKLAGLRRVPVILREATPQEQLELALVENLQRRDLHPLEEAAAYHHLIEDFNLTQEEVARRVGKSRPSIANALRLLNMAPEGKLALWEGRISAGHAKALLGLTDRQEQVQALQEVEERGLSVRQTEELVRGLATPRAGRPRDEAADERLGLGQRVEEELERALGAEVEVRLSRGGSGWISIAFRSAEELEQLRRRLLG